MKRVFKEALLCVAVAAGVFTVVFLLLTLGADDAANFIYRNF
jgi:hypothetical protein